MSPEELYASPLLHWPESISNLEAGRAAAARALERVTDGQVIGIGSGQVAYLTLRALAARAREERGLHVAVVCSSYETETAALTLGLDLRQLGTVEPDWGLDGAAEVASDHRLLKTGAAALSKEKLLWSTVKRMYLTDPSTVSETLGQSVALPVEVHPDGVALAARELAGLGARDVSLRLSTGKDGPVFTESGNLLLDAHFPALAPGLGAEVAAVPGVIETGLFEGYEFMTL